MGFIDIKRANTLFLALLALGVSAGVVVSSYVWWVNTSKAPDSLSPSLETHGFPIPYYTVLGGVVRDFEPQTLIVDVIILFIVSYGLLALLRWRGLR